MRLKKVFPAVFCFIFIFFEIISAKSLDLFALLSPETPTENFILQTGTISSAGQNPAGLINIHPNELKYSHVFYLADISQDSLYYGHQFGKNNSLGVILSFLYTDLLYTRDKNNARFTSAYISSKISYAHHFLNCLSVGASIKFGFDTDIPQYRLPAYAAADLGAVFTLPRNNRFSFHLYLQDIFVSSLFYTLPLTVNLGVGIKIIDCIYTSTAMQLKFDEESSLIGIAVDYKPVQKPIYFRVDYKQKLGEDIHTLNLNFGMGITFTKVTIEYMFSPFISFAENIQKLSLKINF